MNPHGGLTVRSSGTNATYHLVDYADESTREALESLAAGERVDLDLSRVGRRGNVWRANAVTPRLSADATEAGPAAGS
jgi:hypothetical protein